MLSNCLSGLRVLDLSQYIPGPFCTLMLSDLGAEVVKVEPPAGDPMRSFPGPTDADGISSLYKVLNRNKTVIRLDLKQPAEGQALAALVAKADMLMESFRPGTLERLGFGQQRLRNLNPRLVHCALSGYGQTGPYRLRAGHDVTYVALTGLLAAGNGGQGPVLDFPPLADHAGAMQATNAILAALFRRERTGQGAYLDISLFESALSWSYLSLGRRDIAGGRDMLNGGAAWYRIYRTADERYFAFAPIEEKFWKAFCAAIQRPDFVARHGEPMPQSALIADLEILFAGKTLAEWTALLDPADCCFEPIVEPYEVAGHPHVRERGLIREGADGIADILMPCLSDGEAPPERRPLVEAEAGAVMERWVQSGFRFGGNAIRPSSV
ncbi:MAG: CoA transferase [Rhodospirillales bacterium]|nr:CoA transferase [Rhodospirillales bacterium]